MKRQSGCLLLALVSGCTRLPAGNIGVLSAPAPYRVLLVRGFLDWYSAGIDDLAGRLERSGVACSVFRDDQWRAVSSKLDQLPDKGTIVLVGFSYGADDVISISRQLDRTHRPVALLVTIDPVTPGRVPANVQRCIDYYQSNGVWDAFPWLRGVPLSAAANGLQPQNINIRKRADLLEPNTRHATIADNSKLHAAIVKAIHGCLAVKAR